MRIIKKITRALILSIYNAEYIDKKLIDFIDFNDTKNFNELNSFIINIEKENYNIKNFYSLYFNPKFFPEIRKEMLTKKELFLIDLYYQTKNIKKLFEYIMDYKPFGILSSVIASLFVINDYYKKNKTFLMFYGYNFSEYYNGKKYEDIIEDAKESFLKLSISKKQYNVGEISKKINEIDLSFIKEKFSINLFGSVAKGTNDEYSDIDILIIWQNKSNLIPFYEKTIACLISQKFNDTKIDVTSIISTNRKSKFDKRVLSYAINICKN